MRSTNNIKVTRWNKKIEPQAYKLLNKYNESSLFLLSNLKSYGSKLTKASYSANYKCLTQDKQVVAIFALTKTGSLLLQTDRHADYSPIIVNECLNEPIPLRGIIGDYKLAKQALNVAKNKILGFKKVTTQRSLLFQLMINNLPDIKPNFYIRNLKSSDHARWYLINNAFLAERDMEQNENESTIRERFFDEVKHKYIFGLFIDKKLVAAASLVACVGTTGQIGGVYTVPKLRNQGLAKELIYQLALDSKTHKHLDKLILFTTEDNYPAIRLYQSLGFKKIGYFGLFFAKNTYKLTD